MIEIELYLSSIYFCVMIQSHSYHGGSKFTPAMLDGVIQTNERNTRDMISDLYTHSTQSTISHPHNGSTVTSLD